MDQKKLTFIQQNAPCYLYDRQQIIERCQFLQSVMPDELFLYSIKTNPFAPLVASIAAQGFEADAASANEVLLAVQTGIAHERFSILHREKTLMTLKKAWEKCTIIADSFSELQLLETYAASKNAHISIGVRVNPNFSMDGTPAVPSKFGIDENQLMSSVLNFPHLRIAGIHVHLRSQILAADLLCTYYRNCYALAERISQMQGIDLSFINFGSGIGTVYDISTEKPLIFEKLGQTMKELHERNLKSLNCKIYSRNRSFCSMQCRIILYKSSRPKNILRKNIYCSSKCHEWIFTSRYCRIAAAKPW